MLASAANRFEARCRRAHLHGDRPANVGGRCSNDAYVLSTDGRWRSALGNYSVVWQAVTTTLQKGPARPQPDGKPIVPGPFAGGGSLYVGKDGGAHWLWSAWQHLAGSMLEFNDVGYLERKNDYQALSRSATGRWMPSRDTRRRRRHCCSTCAESLDGLTLWRELVLGTYAILESFWSFNVNLHGRGRSSTIARPATAPRCSARRARARPPTSRPIRGGR